MARDKLKNERDAAVADAASANSRIALLEVVYKGYSKNALNTGVDHIRC